MRKNKTSLPGSKESAKRSSQAKPIRRIIVVDDDPFFCHRNAEVLIRFGYEVNVAGDGAAGWEELQANQYHLLITENELPGLNGLELVRKLRSARMALPAIVAAEKLPAARATRLLRLHPVVTLSNPMTSRNCWMRWRVALGATDDCPHGTGAARLARPFAG